MIPQKITQLQDKFLHKIIDEASQQCSFSSKDYSLHESTGERASILMDEQEKNDQLPSLSFFQQDYQPIETSISLNLCSRLDKVSINFIPASDATLRFCRQKQSQKKIFQKRMSDLSQIIEEKLQIPFDFRQLKITKQIILRRDDLENFKPKMYLNGECISSYLNIVSQNMIKQDMRKDVHLYNTYFMTILLGDYITNQKKLETVKQTISQDFIKQIKLNAKKALRWTRGVNLFQKKYIIIPINLPGHWISIIVYNLQNLLNNQSTPSCSILYMDSLGRKHASLIQAIRIFLQVLLESNQPSSTFQITKLNLPDYQLLLPRQTNFYDCGPCTLLNVESILLNPHLLDVDFSRPQNRKSFIKLFPKSLIFTMRQRILNLIINLYQANDNQQQKQFHILRYMANREQLINKVDANDYDNIDNKEFKKFLAIRRYEIKNQEQEFLRLIEFYLDVHINYFQTK